MRHPILVVALINHFLFPDSNTLKASVLSLGFCCGYAIISKVPLSGNSHLGYKINLTSMKGFLYEIILLDHQIMFVFMSLHLKRLTLTWSVLNGNLRN